MHSPALSATFNPRPVFGETGPLQPQLASATQRLRLGRFRMLRDKTISPATAALVLTERYQLLPFGSTSPGS